MCDVCCCECDVCCVGDVCWPTPPRQRGKVSPTSPQRGKWVGGLTSPLRGEVGWPPDGGWKGNGLRMAQRTQAHGPDEDGGGSAHTDGPTAPHWALGICGSTAHRPLIERQPLTEDENSTGHPSNGRCPGPGNPWRGRAFPHLAADGPSRKPPCHVPPPGRARRPLAPPPPQTP
jgi:hypothetical protein